MGIVKFAQQQTRKVQLLEIDLGESKQVDEYLTIISNFNTIEPLESVFEAVSIERQKCEKLFTDTIQKIFDEIQDLYNLEEADIHRGKQLDALQTMKETIRLLHPAQRKLKELGYNTIQEYKIELNEDIKKLDSNIEELKKNISEEKSRKTKKEAESQKLTQIFSRSDLKRIVEQAEATIKQLEKDLKDNQKKKEQ